MRSLFLLTSMALSLGLTLGLTAGASAQEAEDVRMMRLAEAAGCVICHSIGSGSKGPYGLKPIGPAWVKVAQKYRDDPEAVATLTTIVLEGSKPENSHWEGEISSGMGMPANKLVINDNDAGQLVAWILNLAR
ncbi:MAG: c-type cytochrome [Halieaceae bacterium]|jgi:cytochrome c|nr:c-type cytochrome [Halieaceae bacterium]